MNNMHMDKEGASICIGLVDALSKSNYNNRIVCICPLVENIISNNSTKPNDIITAYNGQTVEIIDVDAEGRLILADALSYTCKIYKPDYILDFATLTGWSENINCHTSFTHFTTNEMLANSVKKYGNMYAERSYRIPAWLEYMEYITSNVADVKNYGFECKNSDGFMASLFLMNFIPLEYRNKWIHFDIRLSSYNNTVNVADGFATFLAIIKNI
jgi:leucyl aminopeptidase